MKIPWFFANVLFCCKITHCWPSPSPPPRPLVNIEIFLLILPSVAILVMRIPRGAAGTRLVVRRLGSVSFTRYDVSWGEYSAAIHVHKLHQSASTCRQWGSGRRDSQTQQNSEEGKFVIEICISRLVIKNGSICLVVGQFGLILGPLLYLLSLSHLCANNK